LPRSQRPRYARPARGRAPPHHEVILRAACSHLILRSRQRVRAKRGPMINSAASRRMGRHKIEDTPPRSRGVNRPGDALVPPKLVRGEGGKPVSLGRSRRAQGKPDAGRTRGLVCKKGKTHTSIQVRPRRPGLPCAMVLRLIARSPRSTGLSSLRPTGLLTRWLTPASGGQDHTPLPSACRVPSSGTACVHRIPSRVSDDAYAPPGGTRWANIGISSGFRKEEFCTK
jgi:hypothetical protein